MKEENNLNCDFLNQGFPSPEAELAECSKPCPSNCETCYPITGCCTKCKPGFDGSTCNVGQYICF